MKFPAVLILLFCLLGLQSRGQGFSEKRDFPITRKIKLPANGLQIIKLDKGTSVRHSLGSHLWLNLKDDKRFPGNLKMTQSSGNAILLFIIGGVTSVALPVLTDEPLTAIIGGGFALTATVMLIQNSTRDNYEPIF